MDTKKILELLPEKWICTEKDYPILGRDLTEEERRSFLRNHSILHIMKSLGKLAAQEEAMHHGDSSKHETTTLVGKSIVSLMQVARHDGVSTEDLDKWFDDFFESAE